MIKYITTLFFALFFSYNSFSQLVEGALKNDGRKIITEINPVINSSNYEGEIYFTIAVDEYGKVSGVKVDDNRSTIISTPAKINATKLIYSIKFEPGTHFPKNHTGIYRISYKRN
jgi:hypothetical protein